MMISIRLLFCVGGCGFLGLRFLPEFLQNRLEARLCRAIRVSCIQ